jgi:hypothetical protein
MMSSSTWLTLIVPGIGAALARATQGGSAATAQLAHVAGRGVLEREWNRGDVEADLRPWQRGLLAALELYPKPFASAAVSALGSRLAHPGEYWMHLEPVHFAAGLDRLAYLPLEGETRILETERTSLAGVLDEHLQSLGMELHTLADGTWCARRAEAFAVATSNPEAAASNELQLALPRGPDAGALRRLMTELQMLLHDHPVNESRARRGLPAINAVWVWGQGRVPESTPAGTLPQVFADDSYALGICALHSRSAEPVPAVCEALISAIAGSRRALAVIPADDVEALQTQWIGPLTAALSSRKLARLDFILDDWHLQLDRAALRRFWRKARPPSEWVN